MPNLSKDYPDMSDEEYWEARQNLFGFFSLLLEVDKRISPEFYEKLEKREKIDKDNNRKKQ